METLSSEITVAQENSLKILKAVESCSRRSEIPIAEFENGFAKGWRWAVKKEFSTALDIKLTTRVASTNPIWTSGRLFSFAGQDTIYDTPLAYSQTWLESLKHFKYVIKVITASAATDDYLGSVVADLFENRNGELVVIDKINVDQVGFVRGLIKGF